MDLRLLTIGAEYNGNLKLFGCGIKSADIFEKEIISKFGNRINKVVSLRGPTKCKADNIIFEITNIISDLKNEKVIIYYTGHGNINNGFEYWQTPSGQVCQIKLAKIFNELPDCSSVLVFSDSCDSAHNINKLLMKKSYVSIGATKENEDACMTCDGGVLTQFLIKTIQTIDINCTVEEFWNHLSSYNVSIENFTLACSTDEIRNKIMF